MVLEELQRLCQYAHPPTTPISSASAAGSIWQSISTNVGLQARYLTGMKRPGLGMSTTSQSNVRGSIRSTPTDRFVDWRGQCSISEWQFPVGYSDMAKMNDDKDRLTTNTCIS